MHAPSSRTPRAALLAALLLTAAGCDESAVPLPAPVDRSLHSIEVTPAEALVLEDYARQLEVILRAADGTPLPAAPMVWSSSDTTIAVVDPLGFVRARRPGEVTITAAREGKAGSARIEVEPLRVTRLTTTRTFVGVSFGQMVQVGVTAAAQDGRALPAPVTWTTSDPEVAMVDSVGRITGGVAGTASVKARVGELVAEVVVHSSGPVLTGNWGLTIRGLDHQGAECTVYGVRLGLSVQGAAISGGSHVWSTPDVQCFTESGEEPVSTPSAPMGAVGGLLTGTSVHLQFERSGWLLQGHLVTADRIEGHAYYTAHGKQHTGRFVLVRM